MKVSIDSSTLSARWPHCVRWAMRYSTVPDPKLVAPDCQDLRSTSQNDHPNAPRVALQVLAFFSCKLVCDGTEKH